MLKYFKPTLLPYYLIKRRMYMQTLFINTAKEELVNLEVEENTLFEDIGNVIGTEEIRTITLPIFTSQENIDYLLLIDGEFLPKNPTATPSTLIDDKENRKQQSFYGNVAIVKHDVVNDKFLTLTSEDFAYLTQNLFFTDVTDSYERNFRVLLINAFSKHQKNHYDKVIANATKVAETKNWEVLDHKRFLHPDDNFLAFVVVKINSENGGKPTFATLLYNDEAGGFSTGHYDFPTFESAQNDLYERQ